MIRLGLVLLTNFSLAALLSLVTLPGVARAGLPSGPLAYYPFDVDPTDQSGNGNDGIAFGGPTYVPGHLAGAISLDGIDDYVQLPASLLQNDFTVSFRVRTTVVAPPGSNWFEGLGMVDGEVCASPPGGDIGIALIDGGRVIMEAVKSNALVNDGTFRAVAVTRVGAFTEIFIDGVLDTTGGLSTASPLTGMPWVGVGNNPCDVGFNRRWFPGEIDELRIHDRRLSPAEIGQLAGLGSASAPTLSPLALVGFSTLLATSGAVALRRRRRRRAIAR